MKNFLVNLLISAIAIGIAAYVIPGVQVDGILAAIIVALLLWVANATVGSILRFITAPINLLSLWIMSFIIWVLMILLVSSLYGGFEVDGFWIAVLFALVVTIVQLIIKKLT